MTDQVGSSLRMKLDPDKVRMANKLETVEPETNFKLFLSFVVLGTILQIFGSPTCNHKFQKFLGPVKLAMICFMWGKRVKKIT